MKKKTLILVLLQLCILLTGCQCEHDWMEADCITAKTCSQCGETEGEPLGHEWYYATCTKAKTCAHCNEIKGEALGHTPGDWLESTDIITCDQTRRQLCTVCNELLEMKHTKLTTFSENGIFIFSPEEFLKRFEYFAKLSFPDFQYEVCPSGHQSMGDTLFANIYVDGTDSEPYLLTFCDVTTSPLTQEDFQTPGVWCIGLGKCALIDTSETHTPFPLDLTKAFYLACDPIFSDSDYDLQQGMYLVSCLNWIDYGDQPGYNEINSLLYEFGHYIYDFNGQYVEIETINAYAANWL